MKSYKMFGLLAALAASTALLSPAQAQVSTQFVNAQTGTTYTVLNTDCSKLVTVSNASAVAVTLPQSATSNKFMKGCFFDVENLGAGTVTITPTTSTINGAATLVLTTNQGARVVSDGTNYQVQFGAGTSWGVAPCTLASTNNSGTCNGLAGVVTGASLSTGAGAAATAFDINNTSAFAASVAQCTITGYSGTLSTNGAPIIAKCVPSAGKLTFTAMNVGTQALSGSIVVSFSIRN